MKFVDAEENIVEFSRINAVERVKERGMGADEFCSGGMVKKLLDNRLLGVLASGIKTKIPIRGNVPVCKKSELLQGGVLETSTDILLRNCHDYFLHVLIGEFIKSHKHHGAALARCRWCLDEQVLTMTLSVHHRLHFAHTERIGVT
nr:hypothetical protein [Bacteroides caecimuris]